MPEHEIADEMVEAAAGVVAEEFGSEWPVEHESMDPETGAPVYPEEIADIYRSIAREVLAAAGVPSVLESLDRERQRTRKGVRTPAPGHENAYVSGNVHAAVCEERDNYRVVLDKVRAAIRARPDESYDDFNGRAIREVYRLVAAAFDDAKGAA